MAVCRESVVLQSGIAKLQALARLFSENAEAAELHEGRRVLLINSERAFERNFRRGEVGAIQVDARECDMVINAIVSSDQAFEQGARLIELRFIGQAER